MGLATFRGGVHPYEGKELTMDQPIVLLEPKGEMVFPLYQHIGTPAQPVVKAGDQVLVGQKLGEAVGVVSAPVISSVSGKVKKLEPRRMVNGSLANAVIVENDGLYTCVPGMGEDRDPSAFSKEELETIVRDAGIVGMGGAGFPTAVKLSPPPGKEIDFVLLNGAECEPYLTNDYRMMVERPTQIVEGLKILLRIFEGAKGIIGIENNKPEAIRILREMTKDESRIEVVELLTKYPQGGERSLVKALTGRELNFDLLPSDVGCAVCNVTTVAAVYMAVAKSTPLIRRVVTLSGDAFVNPCNLDVRIGTSHQELIDAAGGFRKEPKKLLSGGPMMGVALFSTDIPVTKTAASILAFEEDVVGSEPETPCIKCSRCIDVCPSFIAPVLMMDYALRDDDKNFERINGLECIECGSCSYVCPAKRPLTQAFKQMKQVVIGKRRMAKLQEKSENKSTGGKS